MDLPVRLISTDFDGTLFAEFENPPVPEALQDLIGQLQGQGVKWVINTGRDMSSLMETLGRASLEIEPDYLVLVEREIHVHDGAQYAGLKHWNDACHADHAALFARIKPDLPRLVDWIQSRFHAQLYEDSFSPFCMIARSNADADIIHQYLNEYCEAVPNLTVVRNDIYARFSHVAYNKGTALAEVARLLKVPAAKVFTIGDHLNDLPMLTRQFAGYVAAPSNAIPLVKAAVLNQQGYISPYPQGFGVADALRACTTGNWHRG